MIANETGSLCGLPDWIGITRNDTAAYINDVLLAVVNGFFSTFAFLSNLAIIVAVVKNPSLQKPSNILLCSLASADCLTGITAQPMFVVWRFFHQRAQQSCSHQVLIFDVYYTLNLLTTGLSFTIFMIISFDRYYALSKPLIYRANATKRDAMKTVLIASAIWLLFIISAHFILPSMAGYIAVIICGALFLVIPIVNHVRMLFAIRRHNNQVVDAVAAHQVSVVMRREKKVAVDMWVVATFLTASLVPAMSMKSLELRNPLVYSIVFPWFLTVPFLTSSFNPVFYLVRNPNLRKAVKSIVSI